MGSTRDSTGSGSKSTQSSKSAMKKIILSSAIQQNFLSKVLVMIPFIRATWK
jgi:hypothetical protein